MPLFTDLEGKCSFMIQFALKIVYMSLAELYFSPPKWPSTIFLI